MEVVITDFRIKEIMETMNAETGNEEWKNMVSQMGLEGQETLLGGKTNDPIPYIKVSKELKNVFKFAFNRKATLKSYEHDVIPVEAMGLIFLAHQAETFDEIYVRFHDADPDPVAIGLVDETEYLIVGWGPDKITPDKFIGRFRVHASEHLEKERKKKVAEAKSTLIKMEAFGEVENWTTEYVDYYLANGWFKGEF